MIIRMYHHDHNPPHIHVQYGEYLAIVNIQTREIIHGKLPGRLYAILKQWMDLNDDKLAEAWQAAQLMKPLKRIKPLD